MRDPAPGVNGRTDDQPGVWQADGCPHNGLLEGLRSCQSQLATPQTPALWRPG